MLPSSNFDETNNGETSVILNSTPVNILEANSIDDVHTDLKERVLWEKHSTGFATKMLIKMNYGGKGLGKYENGIVEPIIINESRTLGGEEEPKKKLMYIASGSMLNQMDEKRLSTNSMDVKVRSHGGCKIRCMYTHLPEIFKDKPEYILFHIGTNDCSEKTSDEVLQELQ